MEILPHREPFLFLEEVLELNIGESARGLWTPTADDWFFEGHFPGRPTLPGVLMVEAIAQLGAYVLLSDPRYVGSLPLFGGIDTARFRRQVSPQECLTLEIELNQLSARAGKGSGKASVEGDLACKVDLLFVIASA